MTRGAARSRRCPRVGTRRVEKAAHVSTNDAEKVVRTDLRQLDAKDAVRLRKPARWIGAFVVLVLVAMLIHMLVTNPNLQWRVVWQYMFSEIILTGLGRTLELTAMAMAVGLAIGIIIALMRLSANPVLNWVSWVYLVLPWCATDRPVAALVQLGLASREAHLGRALLQRDLLLRVD